MEYYNLRLEGNNNYSSSYYSDSLTSMISEYYELDIQTSSKIVKESISGSKTPIELLKNVKNRIQ